MLATSEQDLPSYQEEDATMTIDTTLLDAARRIAPVIRAYREQAERATAPPDAGGGSDGRGRTLAHGDAPVAGRLGGGPADLRAGDRRSRADG